MSTVPTRQTSLFTDPLPAAGSRRLRLPRWGLVTTAVLLVIGWFFFGGLLSLTNAVLHRDAARNALKSAATKALPHDAVAVGSGFLGSRDAFAVGDVAETPAQVLAAFGPGWGAGTWHEIPGTATPTGRSFLNTAQDRILDVKAVPCQRGRTHCPPGGSTVTVEAFVGGPKS